MISADTKVKDLRQAASPSPTSTTLDTAPTPIPGQTSVSDAAKPSDELESKISLLVKEKKDLEIINRKMSGVLPSTDLQRVFSKMIKVRNDIEIVDREKYRLSSLLKKYQDQIDTRTDHD
jgi:hypothetical protein